MRSLLRAGFIHENFLHLLGICASLVKRLNPGNVSDKSLYIAIFVFSAVITGIAFCLVNTGSTQILIGLSGAIASVIGYVFATANNTVRTYIFPVFIIDVNVKALSAIWLAIQCFLMAYYPQSEIAFISHITGFVVGAGMGVLTWGTQYNLSDKGG